MERETSQDDSVLANLVASITRSPDTVGSVLVAMSGGVDSSVAALLLKEAGYDVVGVTLKLFDDEDIESPDEVAFNHKACCTLEDVEDAKDVARNLGFPHYTFNFKKVFGTTVTDRFCAGYLRGETPNPCIDCNRFVKFDALQQRRRELGLDYVATGHYARRCYDPSRGRYLLKRGLDAAKDQSYVLYSLTQDQLAHLLFPLGELTKPQVRALADAHDFVNADKRESQDICFVPDGDYAAFIERSQPDGVKPGVLEPGPIVDAHGHVLGQHEGIARYTIGQRKGLGVAAAEPLYVYKKDAATNTLVVGPAAETTVSRIQVTDVNLISLDSLEGPLNATVKTHYRQQPQPAILQPLDNGDLSITFEQPQRGCAPGQAAVFYDEDIVIGGGTIQDAAK